MNRRRSEERQLDASRTGRFNGTNHLTGCCRRRKSPFSEALRSIAQGFCSPGIGEQLFGEGLEHGHIALCKDAATLCGLADELLEAVSKLAKRDH